MKLISVSIAGGVADVRLNQPEKLNALSAEMICALVEEGERLHRTNGLRAVVLSGEGRGFCAGLDLDVFKDLRRATEGTPLHSAKAGEPPVMSTGQRAVRVWSTLPVPVIAAVSGPALGGGFQLMLGADFRIVAPDARIGMLEILWGLIPDMTGTQILPRLVGIEQAKELILTGRVISGDEAVRIGLAMRTSASPREDALALATEIAAQSPEAVQAAKRAVDMVWEEQLVEGLAAERRAAHRLIGSPNQLEAVRARTQKRAPRFADSPG